MAQYLATWLPTWLLCQSHSKILVDLEAKRLSLMAVSAAKMFLISDPINGLFCSSASLLHLVVEKNPKTFQVLLFFQSSSPTPPHSLCDAALICSSLSSPKLLPHRLSPLPTIFSLSLPPINVSAHQLQTPLHPEKNENIQRIRVVVEGGGQFKQVPW